MDRHARRRGDPLHRRHVVERQHDAAGSIVGVLHQDERGRQETRLQARLDGRLQGAEIHAAGGAGDDPRHQAQDQAEGAHLGRQDMRLLFEQDGAGLAGAGHHRHGIAHRAADDEQARFLAGHLGGQGLELAHGGIALAAVVADVRRAHGFPHCLSRLGGPYRCADR